MNHEFNKSLGQSTKVANICNSDGPDHWLRDRKEKRERREKKRKKPSSQRQRDSNPGQIELKSTWAATSALTKKYIKTNYARGHWVKISGNLGKPVVSWIGSNANSIYHIVNKNCCCTSKQKLFCWASKFGQWIKIMLWLLMSSKSFLIYSHLPDLIKVFSFEAPWQQW